MAKAALERAVGVSERAAVAVAVAAVGMVAVARIGGVTSGLEWTVAIGSVVHNLRSPYRAGTPQTRTQVFHRHRTRPTHILVFRCIRCCNCNPEDVAKAALEGAMAVGDRATAAVALVDRAMVAVVKALADRAMAMVEKAMATVPLEAMGVTAVVQVWGVKAVVVISAVAEMVEVAMGTLGSMVHNPRSQYRAGMSQS